MKAKKRLVVPKIKTKDIQQNVGSINEAGPIIRDRLSKEIIFQTDESIIAYHSLTFFDIQKDKYSADNKQSIESQCAFLLGKFGIYKEGKKRATRDDKQKEKTNPIQDFITDVVGFHRLPSQIMSELEWKVKRDLKQLLTLIRKYESNQVIIDYKKGERRPEHHSKTVIDFYERCTAERQNITDYLINYLEDRVLTKATQDPWMRQNLTFLMFENYRDFPYKWWQPRSIEYFDYEKINPYRHRLDNFSIKEIDEMEELFTSDKKKFYKNLKSHITPLQVFDQFKTYYFRLFSKLQEREPVFNELSYLMKSKKWYSFTALALTQVEGIFSDMLYILYPKKRYSSLSTKVFAVRPFYDLAESSFDYFEYYLPVLRNSFLHSGSIANKNFEYLSYDLLYDLYFLITIYGELKDPHIELNNFLRKDSSRNIFELKDFNHIFKLIDKVEERAKHNPSHKEFQETIDAWYSYERTVLVPSAEMYYWANEMNSSIDKNIDNFFDQLSDLMSRKGVNINVADETAQSLKKNVFIICEALSEEAYYLQQDYESLMNNHIFLKQYKKYLPATPKEDMDLLKHIDIRTKEKFAKLLLLKDTFKEVQRGE